MMLPYLCIAGSTGPYGQARHQRRLSYGTSPPWGPPFPGGLLAGPGLYWLSAPVWPGVIPGYLQLCGRGTGVDPQSLGSQLCDPLVGGWAYVTHVQGSQCISSYFWKTQITIFLPMLQAPGVAEHGPSHTGLAFCNRSQASCTPSHWRKCTGSL